MQIEGKDEIAQLSRQFNSMVGSIRALMSEIQESNQQKSLLQQKQTEIKLKMLASQINPHFLFNALESIRMRAHLKGEAEISNTVQMLGKMMRKNLEVGSRSIPLKSEIEMIHCYLEIQKFRFGERLTYKMDVEPAALNVPVPPLIIQPLVENAVIHGLENKMEVGCIFISVTRLQDELQIEVVDNGIGIYQEKLEVLQSSLEDVEDEKNRIGLRNVHQRLVLTYGNTYGLHIDSISNQETKVSFRIPLGGDKNV
jgi:two-component system sensor histidine kinase YesM